MNAKWLLPTSLLCGLIGGMIGHWLIPDVQDQKTATFETVQVTKNLIVSADASADKGCRISAEGTITATGGLVANQVRGNLIVGHSLLATLNATQQSLEQQQIAVEMTANADRGGELILRNREGLFCPVRGPAKQGFETFLGFDKNNQTPSLFIHNIAQGPQGRAFVACVPEESLLKARTSNPQQATVSQANQPAMQQPVNR
jgi:hypothetical protein